jgi:hypothetical protein
METKDELEIENWQDILWRSMNTIRPTNTTIDSLYDDLDELAAKMNGLNPIVFKNPEKLNGKIEIRGKAYEVTFIGRNLSVKESNWTWVLTEIDANDIEHTLSVLKYPQTDGYATIITNSYGQVLKSEVLRNNLDDKQFILNKLLSLTELPF